MGSSFIAYKKNGFWARDHIPSAIAGLLLIELSKQAQLSPWMEEFRQRLVCAACGYWVGFNTLELDEYITDKERTNLLLWLLGNVKKDVSERQEDRIFMSEYGHLLDEEETCWQQGAWVNRSTILLALDYIQHILNGAQVEAEPKWALD